MSKNRYIPFVLLFTIALVCCSFSGDPIRDKVRKTYSAEVGVREKTGHNDGVKVETYLRYIGLGKGYAWCAAFVCWTYGQSGVKNPRSGYCPDLFTKKYVIYKRGAKTGNVIKPQYGDIFGIYFQEKKRIAHTGFVDDWGDKYAITTEGNTNEAGSREGDGVYRKRRLKSSIYEVANYIDKR